MCVCVMSALLHLIGQVPGVKSSFKGRVVISFGMK